MSRTRRVLLCLSCAWAQAAWPMAAAYAQDDPAPVDSDVDSSVNLESLLNLRVVTASGGVEEERSLAPATVVVFTRDDIARQGWRSLAQILENTPGLDVIDDQVMASVGVRGVTGGLRASTRILKVMIDGVAVSFRPDLAALIGPEFLPIEVVDRVEIAKGPLSAVYGANAFLAVVNVITVKAPDVPVTQLRLRSNLLQGARGFGFSAAIAESTGPLDIVAAISLDRIDRSGLRISKTFAAQDPALARYQPLFQADAVSRDDLAVPRSAFLSLRVPMARASALTVEAGMQQLDSQGEFQLNSILTHKSRVAMDNMWSAARLEKTLSDRLRINAMLGYSKGAPTRDEVLYLSGNFYNSYAPRFRYLAVDAGVQLGFTASPRVSFVVGTDGSYEPQRTLFYSQTFLSAQGTRVPGETVDLIGATERRDVVITNYGIYGQVNAAPLPRLPDLHLTISTRVDVPSLFAAQYSGRTAVAYRVSPALTVKVFAGRAFQVPSAVLLYGHSGFGAANNVIGNSALRPQVVNSVEAAVSGSPTRVLIVEANAFYQDIDDRIEFTQAGADFIARNQGSSRNLGLEMSARALLYRLRPYASASLQRTLAGGSIDTPPPSLYPNLWLRAGAETDVPELHVRATAQVRWIGARGASQGNILLNNNRPYQLAGYARVDLTLASTGWRPIAAGPEVQVMLRAQNLLDDRHSLPGFGGMDLPSLGRAVMIEIGYTR
jgi:outer membrane receptor protein involved in Fe transport